jgi:glycosyltransferase involved in cell wall biosynthesis
MALPSLSVVLTNYNHAKYLPDALRCLVNQSVRPLEVLVVDDGSIDRSVEVIEEAARRAPVIKLVRNSRNRGVVHAFNRGLALVTGDYVYGAAADDQVVPGFFAEALRMAAAHPEAGLIFGDVIKVDDNGNQLARFSLTGHEARTFFTPHAFLHDYLMSEPPGHSLCGATIYRRDCLVEFGGYQAGLGSWVDTFVARAVGLKYGACYIPQVFMRWRYAPNSLAHRSTTWDALKIVRRAARKMRSPPFRAYFPEWYVRQWAEASQANLLRQHVFSLPQRREQFHRQAEDRLVRATAALGRIRRFPVVNIPFALFPHFEHRCQAFLQRRLRNSAERRIRSEEKLLYRRLDPVLRHGSAVRRLCESLALPAHQSAPLSPADFVPDGGHAFRVDLSRLGIFVPSDRESVSQLRVYEDGSPLIHAHYPHQDIREIGEGRYTHWGNYLHLSTSDNSDPRQNGRRYTLLVPRTLLSLLRSLRQSSGIKRAA